MKCSCLILKDSSQKAPSASSGVNRVQNPAVLTHLACVTLLNKSVPSRQAAADTGVLQEVVDDPVALVETIKQAKVQQKV